MYKISVPLIAESAEKMGLEKHLEALKRLNAERVFISIDKFFISESRKNEILNALKKCCDFFHANGIEVGAWLWTFTIEEKNDFIHMKGINGTVGLVQCCPSDENFRKFASEYLKSIAQCGVDIIQFDDDYRYGEQPFGLGCICKNHMEYMCSALGETISENEFVKLALYGGQNKYRSAWQKSKKHYFELFAQDMRRAVDEVNPNIRISLCSCMSVWDIDGIDSASLSRILAGKTKPLLRLIGAPYWAVNRFHEQRLQNIIELERMEQSWCENDIEIMSEGDVYPRPRTNCPANYLEIFDTALRASGGFDGILKYGIDYHSNPGYEMGYIQKHEKNQKLYKEIERLFENKKCCGIKIFEKMQKFEDMVIPKELEGKEAVQNIFFSPAAKMMSDNTIPTVYGDDGVCGIAFAENISAVSEDDMKKGIIIDLRAAEILQKRGIDTGILSIGEKYTASKEYFDFADDQYFIYNNVYDISVSNKAKPLSHFIEFDTTGRESRRSVGSYYYKNNDGYQFLVFAFTAYSQMDANENIFRGYMRSAEIKLITELFGCKLPAYSHKNPDLYIISKKGNNSMAVGLWNIFPDEISEPVIELDKEYSKIEFINCNGKLRGDKVFLSEIPPYGFAGFDVK